jgi:hypothetical protein
LRSGTPPCTQATTTPLARSAATSKPSSGATAPSSGRESTCSAPGLALSIARTLTYGAAPAGPSTAPRSPLLFSEIAGTAAGAATLGRKKRLPAPNWSRSRIAAIGWPLTAPVVIARPTPRPLRSIRGAPTGSPPFSSTATGGSNAVPRWRRARILVPPSAKRWRKTTQA